MRFLILFVFLQGIFCQPLFSQTEKSEFYKTLASDKLTHLETELVRIKSSTIPEKKAYQGALLMKKSKLVTNVNDKLSLFKEGKSLLESEIYKDTTNAEFRFLRLIIQENAPHFLGYYQDLDKDAHYISKNSGSLSIEVKTALTEYIKKSKVLTLHD
jgi:hypothetical protein